MINLRAPGHHGSEGMMNMRYRTLGWASLCVAVVACNGSIDLGSGDGTGADAAAGSQDASGDPRSAQELVGESCIPNWEMCPTEPGAIESVVGFDFNNPMCSGGTCISNHFRGRVSCPMGNPAGGSLHVQDDKECYVPGTQEKVTAAVPPQCRDRKDNVYCTCQCAGSESDKSYCTCPAGFVCGRPSELPGTDLLGPDDKYCVREGNDSSQDGTTCCPVQNPACPDRCDTGDLCGYPDNSPEIATQTPSSLRCSQDFSTFPVNPPGCPAQYATDLQPCFVVETGICVWNEASRYDECQCLLDWNGQKRFSCFSQVTGPNCPETVLVAGADCFGSVGGFCFSPLHRTCVCDDHETGSFTWECGEGFYTGAPDSGPEGVEPTRTVKDMTDTEAQAWCEWFVAAFIIPNGGQPSYGWTRSGKPPHEACVYGLTAEQCVSSLQKSSCGALVSELSDCIMTVASGGLPHPYGCGRYLGNPECRGVVVNLPPSSLSEFDGGPGDPCSIVY